MPSDQRTSDSEFIQQRALERDLVAQLSPSKETQASARAKALRLRSCWSVSRHAAGGMRNRTPETTAAVSDAGDGADHRYWAPCSELRFV